MNIKLNFVFAQLNTFSDDLSKCRMLNDFNEFGMKLVFRV